MFKALAEGWNWTPEQVERLTPSQLIKLSPQSGGGGGGGGPISIGHPAQYEELRRAWLAWNSPEALLMRAERMFQKHQASA